MQRTADDLIISTSWRVRRHQSIAPVLDAIQNLGHSSIELNTLTPSMVDELGGELDRRAMAVRSIHNPCPWPVDGQGNRLDWTAVAELSNTDPARRAHALAAAKHTILLAHVLGAQAVIVHLGYVEVDDKQEQLFRLLAQGRTAEFEEQRNRLVAEREARKQPYLASALASIRELGEYAAEVNVSLGVETRDGYHEIPSLAEFDDVFAATDGLPVYYWHDVGHAEKQRLLGLATQEAYLQRFAGRLIGIHIHDAILGRDHMAPGTGHINLAGLAGLIPHGVQRTLELADAVTAAEAAGGIKLLERIGLA